jgi:hypothetical protein
LAAIGGWLAGRGSSVRPTGNRQALVKIIKESEDQIRDLQRQTGPDWFWKTYFRWAG